LFRSPFACANADPRGKVSKARTKLIAGIASTCTFADPDARTGGNERIDGLGACGDTLAQLDDCVVDLVAKRIGTGLLGTAYGLPAFCGANRLVRTANSGHGSRLTATLLSAG